MSVSIVQDYPFHVASAVCEWIVAFTFVFFFFTYIHDFKVSISLSHIVYSFLVYIYSFAKILLFLFSYSSLPYGWKQNLRISLGTFWARNIKINISIYILCMYLYSRPISPGWNFGRIQSILKYICIYAFWYNWLSVTCDRWKTMQILYYYVVFTQTIFKCT